MSRSSPFRALALGACLSLLAVPAAMATGYGVRHGGQQTIIVTPPAHAGYAQGYYPGVVTVPPGTTVIVPGGRRCDTVPSRGQRFNPGSSYASGWNPHSHYSQGRLPPSHYYGVPSPQYYGRQQIYGRTNINIRF